MIRKVTAVNGAEDNDTTRMLKLQIIYESASNFKISD